MTGMEGVPPLRQQATGVVIADMLRTRLAEGSLQPGSPIGEADLAERLGVSRAPVREALQRLAQEGLLEGRYHRRWTVATIDLEDARDCYFARGLVERAAVRRVVGEPASGEMTAALAEMRTAVGNHDWNAVTASDIRFHEALVRSSDSKRLNRMFATLAVEAAMCLRALEAAYSDYGDIVREHEEVLAALESGDEATAVARIDQHLQLAVERLTDAVDGDR